MTTHVTREQFECAVNFVNNLLGIDGPEYITDDAERNSYNLAMEQISKYKQQIAEYKKAQKTL